MQKRKELQVTEKTQRAKMLAILRENAIGKDSNGKEYVKDKKAQGAYENELMKYLGSENRRIDLPDDPKTEFINQHRKTIKQLNASP